MVWSQECSNVNLFTGEAASFWFLLRLYVSIGRKDSFRSMCIAKFQLLNSNFERKYYDAIRFGFISISVRLDKKKKTLVYLCYDLRSGENFKIDIRKTNKKFKTSFYKGLLEYKVPNEITRVSQEFVNLRSY